MEKAKFTLFQPRSWIFVTLTLLCVCFSSLTINAQKVVPIKSDSSSIVETLTTCNGAVTSTSSVQFTDDGGNDGNYADSYERADTATFCPKDQWHRVKVVFTDFDLAEGDTLFAFQGNVSALNNSTLAAAIAAGLLPAGSKVADLQGLTPAQRRTLLGSLQGTAKASEGTGSGSGVGSSAVASARGSVSDAYGGWIDASCVPAINPTGCLTFIFNTNGDRAKGTGWDAWVDCEERDIKLVGSTIPSDIQLVCDNAPFDTMLTITTPYVIACTDTLDATNDSIIVEVKNASGVSIKKDTISSASAATGNTLAGRFGPGCYSVTFTLLSDQTKSSNGAFCIKTPALTCNDEVNTVFGAACQLSITPDMVLEDACDTSTQLAYTINFKLGDKVVATGTVASPPVISQDSLVSAGGAACNGALTVEVIRTITARDLVGGVAVCANSPEIVTCSTTLKYTDNTAPVFGAHTPSVDTLIQADTAGVAALISQPTATDNCGSVTVTSSIKSVLNATATATADPTDICAYPIRVVIQHIATDECDNASNTLTDTVLIIRPFEFTTPGIDSLECNADDPGYLASGAPVLQVGSISGGETLYVAARALAVDTVSYTAGYILRYSDQVIDEGDCGSKVFRTWSYVDWCDSAAGVQPVNGIGNNVQFIHYFDQTAPEFTYTGADTEEAGATKIDLDFGECTKAISPTAPSAKDDCDTNPTVAMFAVMQKVDGVYTKIGDNLGETGALGCDTFRLRYRVFDDCHTQIVEDSIDRYFILQDVEDPIVVCVDEVFVSVSTSAGVVMQAGSFYKTATDNCGDPSVLIRRESVEADAVDGWGPWGPSIIVKCEGVTQDVNHNSFLVQVKVTDKNGRTNTCEEVKVTPEDKIAPICDPLPNLDRFFCDQFTNGQLGLSTDAKANGGNDNGEFDDNWIPLVDGSPLAKLYADSFGIISCIDNLECGDITVTQEYQLIEKSCGEIEILRRWSATDWLDKDGNAVGNKSQTQTQRITVKSRQNWTLTFPKNETVECRGPNAEGGVSAPATYSDIVRAGACDNFVLNITADTFSTPGETCMKIIRSYELINWCVADVDDEAQVVPNNGELEQIINNETYGSEVGRFIYHQVIKLDVSDSDITIKQNNADDNTENDIVTCIIGKGDIDPFGEADLGRGLDGNYECDTVRVFSATATNCLDIALTKFSYIVYVRDADTDFSTRVELVSGNANTTGEVNVEPDKTYTVDFTAFDDCGNSATNREEYTFRDCKRPTPFVLNGLAVKLGDNCEVEVWAKDLDDNKTFDNCTPKNELRFFISREVRPDNIDSVLATPTVIKLGSTDVGTRIVYIYVVDKANNYDFVRTTINVDNNPANCITVTEGDGMVAGHIVNPNGENVEQVSVSVAGAMQSDMTTGADGAFLFELNAGADYTVTPTKDMNPLNGVSTFDLVLISKHILGITTFDSPYKYIAADVNKSGTITAFDMVQLRQLILSINTEFSNNESWRFVDAEYDFSTSTTNPAAQDFAEFKNINQLAANMMNVDFVGVKVGDVNGSASANSLLGAESRTTNGTLNFNVTDRLVEAGETVTVDFTSANIATAQGYQFTMNFAGLNFDGLTEGVANAANFNTNLAKRGMLTTSWNGEATADEVLFSLTFNATSTGLLSELITVSSDLTAAEAYNTDGELLDVNIEFATADVAVGFALGQNIPNPFNGETVVGFNLPTAGAATLTVMDVQGKVLKEIRGDYAKGYNAVTLKAKELTPGVLYYQLESADQVATKKMIIID